MPWPDSIHSRAKLNQHDLRSTKGSKWRVRKSKNKTCGTKWTSGLPQGDDLVKCDQDEPADAHWFKELREPLRMHPAWGAGEGIKASHLEKCLHVIWEGEDLVKAYMYPSMFKTERGPGM